MKDEGLTLLYLPRCTGTILPLSWAIMSGKKSGESFSGLSLEWSARASCQTPSITGMSVTYLCPTLTRQERAMMMFPHSLLSSNPSCPHSRELFMALKDKKLFFDIIMQSFKLTVLWAWVHEIKKSLGDLHLTLRLKWHQDRLDTMQIPGTLKLRWLGNTKYCYDYSPINRQLIQVAVRIQ